MYHASPNRFFIHWHVIQLENFTYSATANRTENPQTHSKLILGLYTQAMEAYTTTTTTTTTKSYPTMWSWLHGHAAPSCSINSQLFGYTTITIPNQQMIIYWHRDHRPRKGTPKNKYPLQSSIQVLFGEVSLVLNR